MVAFMEATVIKIENLQKRFGDFQALQNISIELEKGKIYGLIGQSGSGKSTLLRCINGLIPYDEGSLTVDGLEVSSLSGKALRQFRRKIGMIFQSFSLLNRLTIYENIALPMKCWGYSKSEIDKRVTELLEMVHIPEKRNSYPRELSGGQKQRVAIARALAMNPEILLCDEATSALDPSIAEKIMELLVEINRKLGITVIIVTHQFSIVRRYCEEVFILGNGRVSASGKCTEIFLDPPPALQAIMGKIDVLSLPATGKNIHIVLPSGEQSATLLSEMSKKINVSYRILSAEQEQFAFEKLFSLFINVEDEDFARTISYLDDNHISWTMKEAV